MKFLRSIGAVALGVLVILAFLYATALARSWYPSPQPFGALDMLITGIRWNVAALVGGFAAAAIAKRAWLTSSILLAVVHICWLAYLVGWESLDFFDPRYVESMWVAIIGCSILGGYIMSRLRKSGPQIDRHGT